MSSSIPRYVAVVLACGCGLPNDRESDEETASAFGAASGIIRSNSAFADQQFRAFPLVSMAGDVEILYGDPEKPGEPFVMRIRELPGTIVPLHSHPVDEHITVVQGTWYFGVGEQWEHAALKKLEVGAYAFVPKGSTMFAFSPDGAVVQVHGVGPFRIHWVNGSRTLDDADRASWFRFSKGERVAAPRGMGTIRQGYASGAIVQYEIQAEDGSLFMASEEDLRRM